MLSMLVYCWKSLCEPLAIRAMEENGIKVVLMKQEVRDYHVDADFSKECFQMIHREGVQGIFSYDYFPILAMIAQTVGIPYVSWIYDCPMYTLQSKTLSEEANHIFCFDQQYAHKLQEDGAKHVYPFLLGTDCQMLSRAMESQQDDEDYACDISLVGSLYNEDNDRLKLEKFTEYTKGYLEGIIGAQQKIYGANMIREALPTTVINEVVEQCGVMMGERYRFEPDRVVADIINKEVTARERIEVVDRISGRWEMALYTASPLPQRLSDRTNLQNRGYVDYERQMPLVFSQSRINLNVTSKTIESGIPQRIADILACGGFCLTNYQPEIGQFLENGREIVMYESMEDMEEKISYYLTHEEERQEIARNGQKRANEIFDVNQKVREMKQLIFS